MSADFVRLVNLVEILKEELEGAGRPVPDDLTDQQLQSMSETDIRRHFQHFGASLARTSDLLVQPSQQPSQQLLLQDLQSKFPPQDHTQSYKTWFPFLSSTRGQDMVAAHPAAVLLCFHSSGNAEDMFTSEGTGNRRVPSALLDACKAHNWLLLAAQLPGRAGRMRDPLTSSLQEAAQQLLPLIAPALLAAGGRYCVVAHSLGCWTAFECLLVLRQAGLPDPQCLCFSAMPWPHIPMQQRPWRQQKTLDEEQFKEECRAWDINETVFSPGMWELYQPLLRADFKLFDEYKPSITEEDMRAAPFKSRLRLFVGQQDRRVTPLMVEAWCSYTTEPTASLVTSIAGNHVWPASSPTAKAVWLQEVAKALTDALV